MNLLKSAIYFSLKTRGQIRQSIREILGIVEHIGAMHYLGIPISGRHLWRADFAEFVALIRARLKGWQSRTFSMMARVFLVRSVLTAVPIYLLSHTIVSKSVLTSLEQLFRNFLSSSHQGRQGIHLLALGCRLPFDQ